MPRILCSLLMIFALSGAQGIEELIHQADAEDAARDYPKAHAYLLPAQERAPDDFEVIWRLAQVHFNLSDNTTDPEAISSHVYDGFEYARQALELNPRRAEAHKWYGILIGRVGELEGTEQKIKNSYQVAEHILEAIALDPGDDGNYHVMGRWHYTLADLSWLERKIAGWVYATPPEASFQEARTFFRQAIEKAPQEVRHYIWLGKTLEELDDESGAAGAYRQALELPAQSDSDRILQAEARELLDDL